SGMGNPSLHDHENLPILVAGGAKTGLQGGRHIRYEKGTNLANLHLTLLDRVGIHLDSFGDSNGKVEELFARIYVGEETWMLWRTISGVVVLGAGLAAPAVAASRSALADAAEQRDQTSVRKLIETGADINSAQVDGTTALHWAAYHDDAETVALLVRAGAN